MTSKTQTLYFLSLQRLNGFCFRLYGELPSPTDLVGDFEIGSLNALLRAYRDGIARGCYFHGKDAILRRARELGLTFEFANNRVVNNTIVRECSCLQLLPSDRIIKAYQVRSFFIIPLFSQLTLIIPLSIYRKLMYFSIAMRKK